MTDDERELVELARAHTPEVKISWRTRALQLARDIAIVIAIVSLTLAVLAKAGASAAGRQSQGACQLYKVVAESPASPKSTVLGLKLLAGARVAYETAHCDLGKLAPVDPLVKPYLAQVGG